MKKNLLNKSKLLVIVFFAHFTLLLGQSKNYTASTDIIANPERGLQKYSITSSDYATKANYNDLENRLSVATLKNWKTGADKVTVIYRYFILDNFLSKDITSIFLNNIQEDFNIIRNAGFKVIVRFSYSNKRGTTAQQPSKSQILKHISQLSTILNTNKDVIFSLQAGFIGTWGEWYYTNSTEFGTDGSITETQWLNRKEVIDAMLVAAPLEIPVQVRYAGIKKKMYGNAQLNEQTAYLNTNNARIGFYNDAFLNNYGDQGTYSVGSECENPVGSADYNYISNETKYLPMTGETNGLNVCNNGYRTKGENVLNELNLTNWTTINRDFFLPFWNEVISVGNYEEILKKIGYRFVLNTSEIVPTNSGFNLNLNISNTGYARPFKKRNVYLVFINTTTGEVIKELINTDIRTWESSVSISQDFNLGLTGTFNLYLWMPDVDADLELKSDYSIRLANEDLWDSETGYNSLLQTVTLGSTLGVDNVFNQNNFSIFPNPSSDFIFFKLKNYKEVNIKVFDSKGKLVKKASVSNNDKLDVSSLAKGVYFISTKNKSFTHKFIKK